MNADGSGKRFLTRYASLYAWSPDGRTIAFGTWRDGNEDIHVMNADGSGQRNLTRTRNLLNEGAVWSPDGRKIAFVSRRGGTEEIWAMDADGSDQVKLASAPVLDASPDWSPLPPVPTAR
jgi:TolB protein